ncbi:MAG: RsmB/NOP family class I SAM-dependent RNA methyltransferase [Planctomycetes bacterium]|nr:RsmB/NOP family class I SAM-dependent RNA methyltransferase [Planctomycetota bacterium]
MEPARRQTAPARGRSAPAAQPRSAGIAEIARGIAERVLYASLRGSPADRELSRILRTWRSLGPADLRFVSRLVFALFRWWGWTRPFRDKSLHRVLFLSYWLDGGPSHPALAAWGPAKELQPLPATATLDAKAEAFRRLTRERPSAASLVPEWFGGMTDGPVPELIQSFAGTPALWVRSRDEDAQPLLGELRAAGVESTPHPAVAQAIRVRSDASLYDLEAFQQGRFEVQDLASQVVGLVCAPAPGGRWWDACAGFGGKTLHLGSLMRGKGTVVATDLRGYKLEEVRRRARRAGLSNISAREWDGRGAPAKSGSFDGVLVDAPCSGTGTWRRNPDARWRTKPSDVDELAVIQAGLLRQCAAGVKPGGLLVYAVCSLLRKETTDIVDAFLSERRESFVLDPAPHPLSGEPTDGRVWVWPQSSEGDGMFVARMRRAATTAPTEPRA